MARVVTSFCFVILIFTTELRMVNFLITLHELAYQLCPYTDFCFKNATENITITLPFVKPCCSPCSCEDDCFMAGNCCPDAQMAEPFLEGVCTSKLVKPSLERQNHFLEAYTTKYKIISSCESNFSSLNAVLCEKNNRTAIGEFIWVSEIRSGKIYKNRYCALCNGVADFVSWDILTDCTTVLFQTVDTLFDVLLSGSCNIMVEPSKAVQNAVKIYEKPCRQVRGYSRCNETGYWRDYDDVIDEACKVYDWPFDRHKNIFCFICNLHNLSSIPLFCYPPLVDFKEQIHSFSILLAFGANPESYEKHQRTVIGTCRTDEIKDEHTKTCRILHCPLGSLAYHGVCKDTLLDINNLMIELAFNLDLITFHPGLNGTEGFNLSLVVKDIFQNLIGFQEANCSSCEYSIWEDSQNGTITGFLFWTKLIVSYKRQCSLDFVRTRTAMIVGQDIVIKQTNYTIGLHVSMETRPYEVLYQKLRNLFVETDVTGSLEPCFSTSLPKIRITEARLCPIVQLNKDEASTLPKRLSKHFLSFFEDKDRTDSPSTISVCFDEYNQIMAQNNATMTKETKFVIRVVIVALATLLNRL